jgi:hypothetical protein
LLDDGWAKGRVPDFHEIVGGRWRKASKFLQTASGVVLPAAFGFVAGAAAVAFVLLSHHR